MLLLCPPSLSLLTQIWRYPSHLTPNPIHVTTLFTAKFTWEGKKIPQPGNISYTAISSSPHVVLEYRFKEHSCGVSSSFPLVLPREELVWGETAPQQSRSSKGLLQAGRGNVWYGGWINRLVKLRASLESQALWVRICQPCTAHCYGSIRNVLSLSSLPLHSTKCLSTAERGTIPFFTVYGPA